MICPRCNTTLVVEEVKEVNGSIEIDRCTSCGGAWFDKGELEKLENIVEPIFVEIRKLPDLKEQMQVLNCPSCDNMQLMEKEEHARDKKVILDYCPSCHGVWLDKGELEAIQKENGLISLGKLFKWLFG